MLGALVVSGSEGEIGYLAGFSGCIAGRIEIDGFVPPIFGRGEQSTEFLIGDHQLGAINAEIETIKDSAEYRAAEMHYITQRSSAEGEMAQLKEQYREAKAQRDERRMNGDCSQEELQLESQRQKGAMKRREKELKEALMLAESELKLFKERIEQLITQRRELSYDLQRKMFESYRVVNGNGEWRSLYTIFEKSHGRLPSSGAGECAAPKMLHYALTHLLTPLAIGEFWCGGSPISELRHHGHFYGACKSRCEPILGFMLQGVDVEMSGTERERSLREELTIVYEDQHLVLYNKPSGMLSVPGRSAAVSVRSIVEESYPDATGGLMVHRLDQDTSGLLLIAKSADVHKSLQQQFSRRTLKKRYVAIVEGVVPDDAGEISLPLITDFDDRPRQMVHYERGKSALTTYEVISRNAESTRLSLTPHTGRTHQLRVHCAHPAGIGRPILGDRLYGQGDNGAARLMLHAEEITFQHPISGEWLRFVAEAPF